MTVYEDILSSVRKARPKLIYGRITNAKIMLEAREKNFVIYSVEGCGEIQKQEDGYFVIIESSENITEYAKENSSCAVPEPVSRMMDAE